MFTKDDILTRESARIVYNKETLELLGFFDRWCENNPCTSLMNGSVFDTFYIGASDTIEQHDLETVEVLGLLDIHEEMKANQAARLKKAKEQLFPILVIIENEIKAVLKKHGAQIESPCEAKPILSIFVNGRKFSKEI